MIADTILAMITTQSTAREVSEQLGRLREGLHQTNFDVDTHMRTEMSEELAEVLRELFDAIAETEQRVRLIQAAEEAILQMPVVQMTFAFRPRERFLERISQWFREQLGKPVLIQPRYDTYLLGGAVVAYKGKHVDVSLRQLFDARLDNYKDAILEQLAA